jgi:peptidoglycan hydrolase CwlO-like protein
MSDNTLPELTEHQKVMVNLSIEELASSIEDKTVQITEQTQLIETLQIEISQTTEMLQERLVSIETKYFKSDVTTPEDIPTPEEAPF